MKPVDIEARLIDLIEGELSDEQTREIEAMIERDPEVKTLYDELRLVLDSSADPQDLAPPPHWEDFFYTRLRARMIEQGLDPAAPPERSTGRRLVDRMVAGSPIRALARIAAAVVLVNALAWSALYFARPDGGVLGEYARALADDESDYDTGVAIASIDDESIDRMADSLAEDLAEDLAEAGENVLPDAAATVDYDEHEIDTLTADEARSLYQALGERLPDAETTQAG